MTKKEAILLSAYTGYLLVDNIGEVYMFLNDLMGRPVYSHELASEEFMKEVQKRCKSMVMELVDNLDEVEE